MYRSPSEIIFTKSNDSVWPSAIGAFLGAFSAFVFGLITFYFQKKFERYWKHKNSVVEIEHMLQDHLDQNSANQYLLKGAIDTLQKNHMSYTLLTPLRLSDDIDLRIGDLDMLQKFYDYKEPIIKVNHGMQTWQGMNTQLHQTVTTNPSLPPPIIHANMKHLREQADTILKFMTEIDNDTSYFLGYVRVYIRKDKHIWSRWLFKIKNKEKQFISKKEIKKEVKVLQSEIEKISSESRKRIEKIMKS